MCRLAEVSGWLQIFTHPWNKALPDGVTRFFSVFNTAQKVEFWKMGQNPRGNLVTALQVVTLQDLQSLHHLMTYTRVLTKDF